MNEHDYHHTWMSAYSDALTAEELVSLTMPTHFEPALIFVSGYQAAIRKTFPNIKCHGWLTFAVSEDRAGEDPKPGVSIKDGLLYGYKSWVAGANYVDQLIVKVGRGSEAQYVTTNRHDNQVQLDIKPSPKFLPLLSQGTACFDGAAFEDRTPTKNDKLNAIRQAKQFGTNEPYYIYRAFLASVAEFVPALSDRAEAALEASENPINSLSTLDGDVQSIMLALEKGDLVNPENWEIDKKLFTMYSPFIKK